MSTMDKDKYASKIGTHAESGAWFWSAMRHYAPIYRHAFMASIVINLVAVATPLFTMNVYDRVIPNNATETLWVLASGIAIIYFFDFVLKGLRSYFVDIAGRNADVVISSMLMKKILTMRLDYGGTNAKPLSTGTIVNNINQFESLRDFFSSSTLLACIDLPFLCIFLIMLYAIGGPLVALPLLAMPIVLVASALFQWAARRSAEQNYKQGIHKNALVVEIINGLETLKSSMAEPQMQKLWENVVDRSASHNVNSRKYTSRALAFASLMTQCVTVSMVIWGVYRIQEGLLTMGGLIACNILAGRSMAPLMQMASLLTRFQNARLSLAALNGIMALPVEGSCGAQGNYGDDGDSMTFTLDNAEASLTLDHVNFAYPEAKRLALRDINLRIKQGERVAIIGGMGSGKSSLAKLIVGLYEPRDGAVRFGDVDIRQMATTELRSRMAFLPQEVVLFSGSIRHNIVLGDGEAHDKAGEKNGASGENVTSEKSVAVVKPEEHEEPKEHGGPKEQGDKKGPPVKAQDQRILRAAELSGVATFVRHLPDGYATQVGEQGRNLSGGQRQAIGLARALVREAHVLILDEPTSHMDSRSEAHVQSRLRSLLDQSPQTSLVLITHRMTMLRLVNRIIVMDAGQVVMDGPKDEILGRLASRGVTGSPPHKSPPSHKE